MTRIVVGRTSGPRSRIALLLTVTLSLVWLSWPLWSSPTSARRDVAAAEMPYLLAALLGLTMVIGVALWLDMGRRLGNLAPLPIFVLVATLARLLLSPGNSGIEPFWVALLVSGIVLGSTAGWISGVTAMLVSAVLTNGVTSLLVTQAILAGCWGLVGGWLRGLTSRKAWVASILLTPVLGLFTGVGLNITGWSQEISASGSSFIPGLNAYETWRRLWLFTMESSLVYDAMRSLTTIIFLLIIGPWGISALRDSFWAPPVTRVFPTTQRATISQRAQQRRERSDTLTTLWTKESDNHE